MPCCLQAASTLLWSRNGCTSIWLVTSGSVASFTASSSIEVVKLATPTCLAWPFFLALQSDLMLSESGTFGLFQWINRRSTQGSLSFLSDSSTDFSKSPGASLSQYTFVVTNTSSRLRPCSARPWCSPSPTHSSLP